jgi:hypothetical protein
VSAREEKRRRALSAAVDDFRARLIPLLKAVSEGRNTGFFVTERNNPWSEVPCSPDGSEILNRAAWILEEAEQLGNDDGSLCAGKVVKAFRVANDLSNPHRLGPIRLAQQLLAELTRGH